MPELPSSASAPAAEPISPAQLREISLADEREQRFVFALKLAAFNGYGLVLCAVLVLLSGLFDVFSWLLAAALGALAYTELRGRTLLARYEHKGLTLLVRNQVALVALVCVYCLSRIYFALQGGNPLAELLQENAELADAAASIGLAEDVATYYRQAIVGFYALIMIVTATAQGACAFYYATRRRHLQEFLTRTPAAVLEWKRTRGLRRG